MVFGIDLTSSEAKPSACICLNDKLEVVFHGLLHTDDNITKAIGLSSPQIVAIDAPLSLPLGLCCLEQSCDCQPRLPWKGRWCEQELASRAIPCYFTTKKSIIKRMVYRGIALKDALSRQSHEVIEVYPYASKVRLFGKSVPPKTRALGLDWLGKKLSVLLTNLDPRLERWSHDMCDAAIAAYTGLLYIHGEAEVVGNTEEGLIYIPISSCGRREGG
jgi:predicted nuclease with RNAse H fold